MILQRQPNKWSCIPTAFSICLDIPVGIILNYFGHDGSELLNETQHRGFHPQELIYYCYTKGYYVIPFEMKPELINENGEVFSINQHFIDYRCNIEEIMNDNIGVIVGTTLKGNMHACAYNGKQIFDPNYTIYNLKNKDGSYNFIIDIFYMIGVMK